MLLTRVSLIIALTALGYAQEALPKREFQDSAAMLQLRANIVSIETSTAMKPEIKEVAKKASDRIEKEYKEMWEPLKALWGKIWDSRDRIEIHNTNLAGVNRKNQAEVDAYNRLGEQLQKEHNEDIARFDGSSLREKLDNFLASPLVTETLRTTEQLLHPPAYFNEGLAWLQLNGLAEGTLDWNNRTNVVSGEYAITVESMPLEMKNSPGALQARKGLVCFADKDYKAAKAWFEQALLKDPDNLSLKHMVKVCRDILSRRR